MGEQALADYVCPYAEKEPLGLSKFIKEGRKCSVSGDLCFKWYKAQEVMDCQVRQEQEKKYPKPACRGWSHKPSHDSEKGDLRKDYWIKFNLDDHPQTCFICGKAVHVDNCGAMAFGWHGDTIVCCQDPEDVNHFKIFVENKKLNWVSFIRTEWIFPVKLPCFDPRGKGLIEKIFEDPVALVVYAQYKRKHLVEESENKWLPHFALEFSQRILKKKEEKAADELTLDEVLQIWMDLWQHNPMFMQIVSHSDRNYWKEVLDPILPYINGKWSLRLDQEGDKFFLVTGKETTKQ